jgi:oligoribonuclease
MVVSKDHLVWLDLEMTGLYPEADQILEIATLVTDTDLNILAQGPVLAIHQSDVVLAQMDDWNQKHHGASGLIDRVRQSQLTVQDAQEQTLAFLKQWLPAGASPLCGNSIGMDRRFLVRYMPELDNFFHYRILDVSSIKELAKRWWPKLAPFPKQNKHEALLDIQESIEELRYYRQHIFIQK